MIKEELIIHLVLLGFKGTPESNREYESWDHPSNNQFMVLYPEHERLTDKLTGYTNIGGTTNDMTTYEDLFDRLSLDTSYD